MQFSVTVVQTAREQAQALAAAQETSRVEKLGDNALAAFIITQAMLKRSRRLGEFCRRPDLNARMPNYTVPPCPPPLLGTQRALLQLCHARLLHSCRQVLPRLLDGF